MKATTNSLQRLIATACVGSFGLTLLPSATAETTSTIDLYRIPEATPKQLERIPKNLARWHMGASLVLINGDQFQRVQVPDVGYFDESVFLSDNSALTFSISEGRHDYIIDLGQFMTVSRFFMNNESAAGSVSLKSSDTLDPIESANWVTLSQPVEFAKGVLPSVAFPEVETRYLLVSFEITSPGLIGNFGATGPLNITQAEFNIGKGEEVDTVIQAQSPIIDFDFASAYTGSRIAFVSGGPIDEVFAMLDEDPTTTYSFPAGQESILILDLRKETQMRTFGTSYVSEVGGDLQVYMVDHLPSYFYSETAPLVATVRDADGMIQRAEIAANDTAGFRAFMAAQTGVEVVKVPESYFLEIEDSYAAEVSANQEGQVKIMDDLARRYVIFRFIPGGADTSASVQAAVYRPDEHGFALHRAQSSGISFGQVEVIGDVEFDDLIFTMDQDPTIPSGPPNDPPDDPPVISD